MTHKRGSLVRPCQPLQDESLLEIRLYLKVRWYNTERAFAIPELTCIVAADYVTTIADAVEVTKASATIGEDAMSQKMHQALNRLTDHNREQISEQTNLIMVLHVDEDELSTVEIAEQIPRCDSLTNEQILNLGV